MDKYSVSAQKIMKEQCVYCRHYLSPFHFIVSGHTCILGCSRWLSTPSIVLEWLAQCECPAFEWQDKLTREDFVDRG